MPFTPYTYTVLINPVTVSLAYQNHSVNPVVPLLPSLQRAVGKFASAVLALPKSIIKLPKLILQHVIRVAKVLGQEASFQLCGGLVGAVCFMT